MRCLILFFILFNLGTALAQKSGIRGTVKSASGEPIAFASVAIEGENKGVSTTVDGSFSLTGIAPGSYMILVSSVGYKKTRKEVLVQASSFTDVIFTLQTTVEELNTVDVVAKSRAQQKEEKPIKIEAIDLRGSFERSTPLPQIINQTAGVKVRQSAGVGSGTSININGLQGRAIRFFRDEVPLDYLGSAFNLSLVPMGQLSGVEIYKGVLPARLGSDALGGAVNFESREFVKNELDVSYGMGSFNTHQANFVGYFNVPKTKLFTQLSGYYVSSDNDYEIDVEVIDPETQTLKPAKASRFHDGTESLFLEGKVGLKNTKAADLFEVGIAHFDFEKENQHGFNILRPFGEVSYSEQFNAYTLRYKKAWQGFRVDVFGAYSDKITTFTDTSSRRYNWFGEVVSAGATNGGESDNGNKSQLQLNFDHYVARAFVSYQLGPSLITLSHTLTNQTRTGNDPFGYKITIQGEDIDPFSVPADYLKNISGIQVSTSLFNDKLTHLVTAKRYMVNTSSLSRTSFEDVTPSLQSTTYGLGTSFKYAFTADRFMRLSYEKASRIPEPEEYFGDGRFIVGNNDLMPERSNNVNLGFYTDLNQAKNVFLDVNAFYRYVNDQIVLQPIFLFLAQHQNKDVAQIKGLEASLKANLKNGLRLTTSITWQDVRRIEIEARDQKIMEGSRVPFQPYFFTNLNLNYTRKGVLQNGDRVTAYANHSFIEKYVYLAVPKNQEPGLFERVENSSLTNLEDLTIPTQQIVDIGISYKWANIPFWINVEMNNALNTKAFDNYRIQKAPRNFNVKLRYVFNQK